MTPARLRQSTRSELLLILGAQLVIEALYFLLGVRMDIFPILGYWQLADPMLLKTDLLSTVFYFHVQPPGYNLLVGVILKLFPLAFPFVLQALHLVVGIVALWSLFELQVRFRVPRALALVTTVMFGASPGYVLFGHHTLYSFLVATLWISSALVLHNYLLSKRFGWLLAFFALLWILAWTRTLIHIVYVVALLGILAYKTRPIGRKHVVAATVLLLLVLAPYVKNRVVFGKFTQSTWFAGNLAKVVTFPISFEKRQQLHRDQVISRYSAYIWQPDPESKRTDGQSEAFETHIDERGNPFWSSSEFLERFRDLPRHPILFSPMKSTSSAQNDLPNVNYVAMIGTYDEVMKDNIKLAMMFPNVVVTSWFYSFLIYYTPSYVQKYISNENLEAAAPMTDLYDTLYGKVPAPVLQDLARWLTANWDYVPFINPEHIYLTLLLGLPLVLVLGIRRWWRMQEGPDRLLLLFVLVTVVFVMLVGNLTDCGENNRFRFMTDFFYVFLTGLALQPLADKARRAIAGRRGAGTAERSGEAGASTGASATPPSTP